MNVAATEIVPSVAALTPAERIEALMDAFVGFQSLERAADALRSQLDRTPVKTASREQKWDEWDVMVHSQIDAESVIVAHVKILMGNGGSGPRRQVASCQSRASRLMHHARLATSPRLRRTLKALQQADGEISTLELLQKAKIANVSATISELRANGAGIICRQVVKDGQRLFFYTLTKSPEDHL